METNNLLRGQGDAETLQGANQNDGEALYSDAHNDELPESAKSDTIAPITKGAETLDRNCDNLDVDLSSNFPTNSEAVAESTPFDINTTREVPHDTSPVLQKASILLNDTVCGFLTTTASGESYFHKITSFNIVVTDNNNVHLQLDSGNCQKAFAITKIVSTVTAENMVQETATDNNMQETNASTDTAAIDDFSFGSLHAKILENESLLQKFLDNQKQIKAMLYQHQNRQSNPESTESVPCARIAIFQSILDHSDKIKSDEDLNELERSLEVKSNKEKLIEELGKFSVKKQYKRTISSILDHLFLHDFSSKSVRYNDLLKKGQRPFCVFLKKTVANLHKEDNVTYHEIDNCVAKYFRDAPFTKGGRKKKANQNDATTAIETNSNKKFKKI